MLKFIVVSFLCVHEKERLINGSRSKGLQKDYTDMTCVPAAVPSPERPSTDETVQLLVSSYVGVEPTRYKQS